jgi:hypothetical protein
VVRSSHETTQVFEGAHDLDLKPVEDGQTVVPGRVFVAAGATITLKLSIDVVHWTPASIARMQLLDPGGVVLGSAEASAGSGGNATLSAAAAAPGFHSISITAANLPLGNKQSAYKVSVRYTAPKTLQ